MSYIYSSELADIINSACIKIESLAKDIYENHIFPFQIDLDITPISFKGSPSKFNEKWTREKWKYDYNCLVEIDKKFSLGKKRVQLKIERFHFSKYGRIPSWATTEKLKFSMTNSFTMIPMETEYPYQY